MEAVSRARFVRISDRKVNQILAAIRRKQVDDAFKILQFLPKAATLIVEKVLHSAVSNLGKVENPKRIIVKEAYVGQGPAMKRMRPAAMGRGFGYKRKLSHLTIVVGEKLN
ncbi:MAG: 50S ribosomal protein L22 [bacterium]